MVVVFRWGLLALHLGLACKRCPPAFEGRLEGDEFRRLLVSFAYYHSPTVPDDPDTLRAWLQCEENLRFFYARGAAPLSTDVVVTAIGDSLEPPEPPAGSGITVRRLACNRGADLFAHSALLQSLGNGSRLDRYSHFAFLNCGVRGPYVADEAEGGACARAFRGWVSEQRSGPRWLHPFRVRLGGPNKTALVGPTVSFASGHVHVQSHMMVSSLAHVRTIAAVWAPTGHKRLPVPPCAPPKNDTSSAEEIARASAAVEPALDWRALAADSAPVVRYIEACRSNRLLGHVARSSAQEAAPRMPACVMQQPWDPQTYAYRGKSAKLRESAKLRNGPPTASGQTPGRMLSSLGGATAPSAVAAGTAAADAAAATATTAPAAPARRVGGRGRRLDIAAANAAAAAAATPAAEINGHGRRLEVAQIMVAATELRLTHVLLGRGHNVQSLMSSEQGWDYRGCQLWRRGHVMASSPEVLLTNPGGTDLGAHPYEMVFIKFGGEMMKRGVFAHQVCKCLLPPGIEVIPTPPPKRKPRPWGYRTPEPQNSM
jgi:hypothetical protein